jgi:hypothetical protein
MGKVLDFLFGKDNNVFNSKGRVNHDLGKTKWNKWTDRFGKNPDYDFTNSHGLEQKKHIKPSDGGGPHR